MSDPDTIKHNYLILSLHHLSTTNCCTASSAAFINRLYYSDDVLHQRRTIRILAFPKNVMQVFKYVIKCKVKNVAHQDIATKFF